ncbi:oligouridylate binding protein-like protein [Striga asiatica]|uniref:Oligouridylate binding protein-like protein n=1 Tax=Striga asiatica TaxID=4170 RepID=A0A5A7P624_STRAF|nr:oligouridylate binding protein-like protein [Striga asiatica]
MQNQRLKQQQQQQQQALMQQAILQQQSLYHPGLLAAPQDLESGVSFISLVEWDRNYLMCTWYEGNLVHYHFSSDDVSWLEYEQLGVPKAKCYRYVGNIHIQVTEPLLQEVFASTGPVEVCKLIRKEKSSYGFIHYFDRRSAGLAILSLNGRHLFGQPIKVNWAYASGQKEDTSGHFNIFVGDLSPEVNDAMLLACFSVYPSCSDAKVMWDQKTGRSRGFGFVSFRNQEDAQSAINELSGKWLGSRQIRCNWATKGAGTSDEKANSDAKSVVELTNGSTDDVKEATSSDAPENNPQYTTVYVTQADLHRHFHAFGAGSIEEVRVQRDKGFGFVRYSTHAEAAMAISMGNTQSYMYGKQIKCSWGNKPTPHGTASNPLPPPAPATLPGLLAADLLAYERQLARVAPQQLMYY